MKRMKRGTVRLRMIGAREIGILLVASLAVMAEPSVYGRSYSSGSAQVAKNKNMIYSLQQKVARQQEEIEGLKSLLESLSQRLNQLSGRKSVQGGSESSGKKIRELEARIEKLEKRSRVTNAPATRRVPVRASSKRSSSTKESGKAKTTAASGLEKAPSDKLFSRGVRLVKQRHYTDAKKRFDILLKRNYKLASTNFYQGEIAYRTGRYDDAIKFYQKSAELNENAAYMDRLLLHTAISLEKSGDREQAKNFFQAIVDGYPGTGSAREAKKHLK